MPYKRRKRIGFIMWRKELKTGHTYYVEVFVWRSHAALMSESGIDGDCLACYIPMPRKAGPEDYYHKPRGRKFGEFHFYDKGVTAGILAHELTHFICDWISTFDLDMDRDSEQLAQIAETITRQFWNRFYDVQGYTNKKAELGESSPEEEQDE